jgi:hypothetical protein
MIKEQIQKIRNEWAIPHFAPGEDEQSSFRLKCSFGEPCIPPEQLMGLQIPAELREFWRNASTAKIFEDVEYGQWGLQILSPSESELVTNDEKNGYRSKSFRPGDLVVGQFIGDGQLLIVRCDPAMADFGSIVIAEEIYGREDWSIAARDFSEFLNKYANANGDMYWELSQKDIP